MEKWKLAEHQLYATTMMDFNDSLAIFYEAGTGKTAIALAWAYQAVLDGRIKDLLVVCPASMVGTWNKAIDKMLNFEGFTEEGVQRLKEVTYVTSFQKTYQMKKHVIRHKDGRTTLSKTYCLRAEVDKRWGAIIVDESHCIGDHKSRQTKTSYTLAKLAEHRYIMSGTPVSGGKGGEDFQKLYGQLRFLDPDIWKTWAQFQDECVTEYDHWGKPAAYDVEHCRSLMKEYGIVCRLSECFDMPETTETSIPCALVQKKEYKDIQKGNLTPYGIDVNNAGGQYTKLLQLCSGHIKRTEGNLLFKTSKDEAIEDLIRDAPDKVVVFCTFTASVDRVAAIGEKLGRKVTVFDGRSHGETWREFQEGDSDLLVCQYQAGGVGLDLFASNVMIFWEPTLSTLLLTQAKARIYRKGQERHCRYYYLYTPGTIEQKVMDTVRRGDDVTNEMLEEWAHDELDPTAL